MCRSVVNVQMRECVNVHMFTDAKSQQLNKHNIYKRACATSTR